MRWGIGSVVVLAAVVLAACGEASDGQVGGAGSGGAAGGGGSAGASGAAAAGGTSGAAGADAGVSGDLATFEQILDGSVSADAGLIAISHSGGLPVATPEGFLFVRRDDGAGPYSLAGDMNGWQPAAMTKQAGVYFVTVAIAAPDGVKYKFVDGQGTFAADPLARRYGWDEFGEYSLVFASAPHRERWSEVSGLGLPARTVRAWVPTAAPKHHLYVHDGQNLFEPDSMFGGWKLEQTVGADTLVIGIDNAGAARIDEYTHVVDDIGSGPVGGKADTTAELVEQIVRPLVEARHGKPAKVGVMGSSLGGLLAFHQVLQNPGRYDFAASLSGTFGWGSIGLHNETLIERFEAAGKQSTLLYLDSGGGPGSGCVDSDQDGILDDTPDSSDNYCETVQLRDVLLAAGYENDKTLWHWWEPDAAHNEAAWAARVFRPVQLFEAL